MNLVPNLKRYAIKLTLGAGSSDRTCLASMRSCIQIPVPPKNLNKIHNNNKNLTIAEEKFKYAFYFWWYWNLNSEFCAC
jgi:hypothetical protein